MRFLYCRPAIPLEDLCDNWHFHTSQVALCRCLRGFLNLIRINALVCKQAPAVGRAASIGAPKCWTSSCWPLASASSCYASATRWRAITSEGNAMIFDYSLAGLVSAGLLFYLTYALLRPERF
jgi:K+-transporting ATPase KdpF subunit